MYNYHNYYCGETNKIIVIGNKSRSGELDTTRKSYVFHRDAKGN